ncbi:MAG: MBL fold metallo-hydrolase [Hydrogenophaga sp.]
MMQELRTDIHPETGSIDQVLHAAGVTVFERGWLSANNILIRGDGPCALIDSGYCTHAPQTLALLRHALGAHPLDLLINTHLHSDHCGGNAVLQDTYPGLQTWIPPGQAEAVANWDEDALTYRPTGQSCPRFCYTGLLQPGSIIQLGSRNWEVHGAKGHDPHSIILFQRDVRLLVSADALWQNGFGVVFPELEGTSAFDEVSETLDLIEQLAPHTVIPGHGSAFQDVEEALARARSRLSQFQAHPDRHQHHAAKVLIKFRLLEWQRIEWKALLEWGRSTPYMAALMPPDAGLHPQWLNQLIEELVRAQALSFEGDWVVNR